MYGKDTPKKMPTTEWNKTKVFAKQMLENERFYDRTPLDYKSNDEVAFDYVQRHYGSPNYEY